MLIGEPTGGSTGDPLTFALPGGGLARVSTTPNLGAIQPHVAVPRTVTDFLAGNDAALSAALARLLPSRAPSW
jgi:carboxyl-terminal processing protease